MDDVKLANWLAGLEPGPIEVGLLGAELLAALALPAGLSLLLSDYTLTKIRFGHPEIDLRDYQRLPDILLLGYAYRGRRKRSLEIVGMGSDEIEGVAYRACIKATAKNEVYLVTFHRVDWKEARRLYRRASKVGGIVREPKGKLAQRLSRRAS